MAPNEKLGPEPDNEIKGYVSDTIYIRYNPNNKLGLDEVSADLSADGSAKTILGKIGKRIGIGNSDTCQGSASADPMSG